MAIEKDLNVNPYYDDYDEDKNFNRVLFKPAVPLQARELTQLQTILQNQIERFGQYQFKEGSIIKGCSFTFDQDLKYAKINDKDTNNLDVVMSTFGKGDYIRNQSNLVALVADTATGLETQNPGLNSLFFHYLNVGTGDETQYGESETLDLYPASGTIESVSVANATLVDFSNSDLISFVTTGSGTGAQANIVTISSGNTINSINVTANGTGFTPDDSITVALTFANGDLANSTVNENFTVNLKKTNTVTIANTTFEQGVGGNAQFNAVGEAFSMTVSDGIIFQKGHFQKFDEQSIVVTKFTNRPDGVVVGINTTEAIVNSSSDTSLLDNASGFNNENAPGADRLKLTPTLVVNTSVDAAASNNFLSIVEFQAGRPLQLNQKAQLNRLGDQLARRTYEESGDYVVDPFSLITLGITGNTTHIIAMIGAGTAYNKGFRTEIESAAKVQIAKAKTSQTLPNQTSSLNFGNYVVVDNVKGDFGATDNDSVILTGTGYNSHTSANTVDPTSVTSTQIVHDGSTKPVIGTARVRAITSVQDNNNNATSKYHLYLYDIQMGTGQSFSSVQGLCHYSGAVSGLETNTGAYFAFADVVDSKAKLIDVEKDTLVFPLGQAGIKTVADGAKYTFRKRFQATFATSGAEQLAAGDDLKFNFGDGTLSNTQEKNIIIIPTESVNAAANIGNGTVANSTVTTITGITSTATIRVGDFYFVGTNGPFQTRSVVNSSAIVVDSAPTASGNLLRTFPKDYPISLDDDSSANVVISASSDTMTIDLNETLNSTMGAKVFVDLVDENNNKVDKTVKQTEVAIDVNTHGGANANNVTGPWSLGVTDVFQLVSVFQGSGGNVANSSNFDNHATNVTDEFTVDAGQRDGYYGLSNLKLKPGSTLDISNTAQFCVTVRHFQKDSGQQGFFSINSYPVDDANTANTQAITTQQIPMFTSPKTGREYDLRNHLDFRPEVANTATEAANCSSGLATVNPSNSEIISELSKIPSVDTNFTANVSYYLPRKDRIVLESGKFHVVQGIPGVNPQLPQLPVDAMQLATVDVPVYPSLAQAQARVFSRPDLGVILKATQLKRYTMEDIRDIDDRVTNLEYYSSLNLLEKYTSEKVLPGRTDPATNRFKNGFIVDNFASKTTGNPLNTEFKAGFDQARDLLVSRFETYSIPMRFATGNRLSRSNDLLLPRYKNRKIINQQKATRQRTVTSKFWSYNGTVQLFPDYLAGIDNIKAPEAAVQIDIDSASSTLALIEQLNKVAPQQMTSSEVIADTTSTKVIGSVASDTQVTNAVEIIKKQTIRKTTTKLSATARTTQKRVGDFVTDMAFQPYIPGTVIRFVATGLRPGLRHYVYFDGRSVTEHCKPAISINPFDAIRVEDRLSSSRAKRMIRPKGAFNTALRADSNGSLTGVFRVPANTFFAGEREFIISDATAIGLLEDSVSQATAMFNCYNFSITKGDIITSTRRALPRATLKQQTVNNYHRDVEQVITPLPPAEVTVIENHIEVPVPVEVPVQVPGPERIIQVPGPEIFVPVPGPTIEVPGPTIPGPPIEIVVYADPAVLPPEENPDPVPTTPPTPPTPPTTPPGPPSFEPNNFKDPNCDFYYDDMWVGGEGSAYGYNGGRYGDVGWSHGGAVMYKDHAGVDPLAQTFLIDSAAFGETGSGYLSAIDVYFSAKDLKRGCSVEIRETINGVPGPRVIPFSRTHKPSSQINVSSNGNTSTTFVFKSPLSVIAGAEYCVVILPDGNSPEYKVWTAKAGEKDIRTSITSNQDWGAGTMFLSTNNRTWTEYVDEDLKFAVYSAFFLTTNSDITLENDDVEFLQSNSANINGAFTPGEEVFKLGANVSGTVVITAGQDSILANSGINFTTVSGLSAGSRIVLTGNSTTYDVVEVDGVTNSSHISLRGAPNFSDTSGSIIMTPVGEMVQFDANTHTFMLNDSSASSASFLFANNDTIIGAESNANAVINEVVDTNISYLEPRMYRNVPNGTEANIQVKAKKVAGTGTYEDYRPLPFNDRYYSDTPIKIMSKSNEIATESGTKSLNINYHLTSDDRFTSPSVDLQAQEILVYENLINNDRTNEHKTNEGLAQSKYVSRTIELGEGLDAEDIRIFLNAYKPANTDIHVYAKLLNAEDSDSFEDKDWSLLQRTGINKDKISSGVDREDVIEYDFEFVDTPDTTVLDGKAIIANIGDTTVTGQGTTYNTDLSVGDRVKIVNLDNQTDYTITTVTAVGSDTSITVADAMTFASFGTVIAKVNLSHINQAFRDPDQEFEVVYYNSSNQKFIGYKYLAIKIVMTADSTALNPYIQDYRAIAVSL